MMCAEEVFEIAKKIKMPVYMYDTDSALFWLSRFAKAAETPSPEATAITGKKSRPLYSPSRSLAVDDQHIYIFHNGLWYHFSPKGWEVPDPQPQNRSTE